MMELVAKIVGVLAEFSSGLLAYLWARERARAAALEALREREHAIRDASERGPRDAADAAQWMREGRF
tara:strand:- start:210901 stop:211104 length:204 start_codon:yes stop_codon:yes gene_type:complete